MPFGSQSRDARGTPARRDRGDRTRPRAGTSSNGALIRAVCDAAGSAPGRALAIVRPCAEPTMNQARPAAHATVTACDRDRCGRGSRAAAAWASRRGRTERRRSRDPRGRGDEREREQGGHADRRERSQQTPSPHGAILAARRRIGNLEIPSVCSVRGAPSGAAHLRLRLDAEIGAYSSVDDVCAGAAVEKISPPEPVAGRCPAAPARWLRSASPIRTSPKREPRTASILVSRSVPQPFARWRPRSTVTAAGAFT